MAQRKEIISSIFRQLKPLNISGPDKSQPPFTRAGPPTLAPRPPSMRAGPPTLAPRPPCTRAGPPTLAPRPPPKRAGPPTLAPLPPPTRAGFRTLVPRPPPTRAGSPTLAPRPPPTRAGFRTLVPRPPSMRAPLPVKRTKTQLPPIIPQSPSRKNYPPKTRPKYTDDQEEPEVMGVADFNTGLEHWWRKKCHVQTNVFDLRMIRMSLKSQLAGEQHQLSVLKEERQIQLARLNESKPEKLRNIELTYELGIIAASYARLLDEHTPREPFMQLNMIERCHRMARSLKE